jgi:hypothetical protein
MGRVGGINKSNGNSFKMQARQVNWDEEVWETRVFGEGSMEHHGADGPDITSYSVDSIENPKGRHEQRK